MNIDTHALPDLLLTTKELATVLRCSLRTAKDLVGTGTIPSVKIAGLRRVRRSELEAYIADLTPDRGGVAA